MTPAGDTNIDDDPARVDVDWLWAFLSADAYWGRWRTRADLEAQLTAAWRVVGAYERATGRQVGFARAVSDGVALGYLADVFVATGSRGRGIGQALVAEIVDTEPGAGSAGCCTRPTRTRSTRGSASAPRTRPAWSAAAVPRPKQRSGPVMMDGCPRVTPSGSPPAASTRPSPGGS
jgi:GNAT superfamily N-acetyltransferase